MFNIDLGDFKDPIQLKEARLNGYGLDLTDEPDYIRFVSENIEIELMGGITDTLLSSLRVSFKIKKLGESSAMHVYRAQMMDLFNENTIEYVLRASSERLMIDPNRLKPILYDFIERIDRYRRAECKRDIMPNTAPRMATKQVKKILLADNVPFALETLLQERGILDTKLAMKLFLIGLSRLTNTSYHAILMGDKQLCHGIVNQYSKLMPDEHLRAVTTISKHALSHPPYEHYWDKRLLVLDQFSASVSKASTIEEYLLCGHSRRIITENDKQSGTFRSSDKLMRSRFSVLSYTDLDTHPVFYSPYVFCIPVDHEIKDRLFEEQIQMQAGLVDIDRNNEIDKLFKDISLSLTSYEVRMSCIETLDLKEVFQGDNQKLGQFLMLIKIVALLDQKKRGMSGTNTHPYLEASKKDIRYIMELFADYFIESKATLSWNVEQTWTGIKELLKKRSVENFKEEHFTVRQILPHLSISPGSLARHIKTLESHYKIERKAGNNRTGFEYAILDWNEAESNAEDYQKLLTSFSLVSHPKKRAGEKDTEVSHKT